MSSSDFKTIDGFAWSIADLLYDDFKHSGCDKVKIVSGWKSYFAREVTPLAPNPNLDQLEAEIRA